MSEKSVLSPFLFNFIIDQVMEDALGGFHDVCTKLTNGEKLRDLQYTHSRVCLFECIKHVQRVLDKAVKSVAPFVMGQVPSNSSVVTRPGVTNCELDTRRRETNHC